MKDAFVCLIIELVSKSTIGRTCLFPSAVFNLKNPVQCVPPFRLSLDRPTKRQPSWLAMFRDRWRCRLYSSKLNERQGYFWSHSFWLRFRAVVLLRDQNKGIRHSSIANKDVGSG